MSDIKIQPSRTSKSGNLLITGTPVTAGYFNLYFETGSGMESTTITAEIQRRTVAVKVFEDISLFINSPLTSNGLNNKVNIWVRNINETLNTTPSNPNPAANSSVLGSASSYYINAINYSAAFGGIADNEIWKTIHTGKDSFTNVISPLVVNGINSGIPGVYFHGQMAFNFNNPGIIWHYNNLANNPPAGAYDLYSVILHEITHALGFASLINQNGTSKLDSGYNYFTRYDRFLRSNSGIPLLINTGACSTMYNYAFNTSNLTTAALHPGCTLPGNINATVTADQTVCSTALKFYGSTYTVPVYTPTCFENPSSFAHFEDQCVTPNINNAYFAMAETSVIGANKRYLKPEEKNVLCDLGYNVNSTFGNTSRLNYINYGGSACGGIIVAGINDGIDANGLLSFVSNSNTVSFSGILSNDTNATGVECLYDITSSTAIASVGTNTTTFTVNRNAIDGLHLLRYVPTNGTQKGNITYVYVYFLKTNCGSAGSCDMVINGGFEANTIPDSEGQIMKACGWEKLNINGTPDLFHMNASASTVLIPCNTFGIQNTDNPATNKAYAGTWLVDGIGSETFGTKLASPLLANTTYILSFDLSLAESQSGNAVQFQAYLSTNPIVNTTNNDIPIINPSMLFTSPTLNTMTNGWQNVVFTFTTSATAGQQYLYIGGLSNVVYDFDPARIVTDNTCSHLGNSANRAYYYVDNVSLKEQRSPAISGSTAACTTAGNNATSNISNIPVGHTGQWTIAGGTGTIVGASNQSTLNVNWSQLPGYLSFSLTNPNGCVFTQSRTIADQCACNCLPTTTFTPVISNNVVTITLGNSNPVCTSGNRKMIFNFGDGTVVPRIGSTGSILHAYANPGTYTVSVSVNIPGMHDENLCTTSNFTFNVQPTADPGGGTRGRLKEDLKSSPIVIYPNPVSSEINIDFHHQIEGKVTVKAYDINGKLLFSRAENVKQGNQHLKYLVPSAISDGVLILEVQYDGASVVKKIMINN